MTETFYIVGPTGVGKSEIAAEIAVRLGAEIVGADALQIYEGFPLLTAKPSPEILAQAPHHLIGCVPVTEEYSVARYLAAATACLAAIKSRGRPALVVGGAGLYVKALTHGLSSLPEAQPELRTELEQLDLATLTARLNALDPVAAGIIDRQNKRRLVRAIEVCLVTGRPFSEQRSPWKQPVASCGVMLTRAKDDLHQRIGERVEAMCREGVVEEVRSYEGGPLGSTASKMIGLDSIRQVLAGTLTLSACRERIKLETCQYAKRQVTWFKRENSLASINLTENSAVEEAVARMQAEIDRS